MDKKELLEKAQVFESSELEETVLTTTFVGKLRQHPDEAERAQKFIIIPRGKNYGLEFGLDDMTDIKEIPDAPEDIAVSIRKGTKCVVHLPEEAKPKYAIIQRESTLGFLADLESFQACCSCCGWYVHEAVA